MSTAATALADFHSYLIRSDVHLMSEELLGVSYSELTKIIYPNPPYRTFSIAKKDGTARVIQAPRVRLKLLQEKLLAHLYKSAGEPKPCVHGFTPGRSILTNAKVHCSNKTQVILNIDINDFFPSITFYRVRGLFQSKPFNFSYPVATVLAQLCTVNGLLPQGAPTSPLLANLICRTLDRDLMRLAKRHRATYTRYADDITFSFSVRKLDSLPENICTYDSGTLHLGEELRSIFSEHHFDINPSKSRISTRLSRLEVTGLTINEFPNVQRKFIDKIRGALHAWEAHGYELAQANWDSRVNSTLELELDQRAWRRQRRTEDIPQLQHVLWGRLLYVMMVRGKHDGIYTKLAERYNSLCERDVITADFNYRALPVELLVSSRNRASNAVFVIEWMGNYSNPGGAGSVEMVGGQGTAFAYKNHGLVTCDHIFVYNHAGIYTDAFAPEVSELEITVTNPNIGRSWQVRLVNRDAGLDLALLQFEGITPSHPYFGSVELPSMDRENGILIGYPNHSPGRPANFLDSEVLSRFTRSGLNRFEINGNIRQGNSGGPFVDSSYAVVGVAQQGATQDSGNDECLSVEELDSWLAKLVTAPVIGMTA